MKKGLVSAANLRIFTFMLSIPMALDANNLLITKASLFTVIDNGEEYLGIFFIFCIILGGLL